MNSVVEQKIEEIRSNISTDELEAMARPFTLADAIRQGAQVSDQAYGWGDGNNACALSCAVMAAVSRGYLEM